MNEIQKDSVIRRWNQCDHKTKIRMAAEFFTIMRTDKVQGDWWQFLDKKFSPLT